MNEKNNEKGAFIFDTNTYEHSYINITPRKRVIATFDIKEYLKKDYLENIDLETLKLHFQNFIESLSLTEEELVIINFIIENNQYINTKEFEEILEKNGALKGYIIPKFSGEREFETTPLDYEDCALTHIEKGVINKWEGGYFQKIDTVKYLLTLKNLQLNKDDPNTFNEVFDKMLMEVIGDEN